MEFLRKGDTHGYEFVSNFLHSVDMCLHRGVSWRKFGSEQFTKKSDTVCPARVLMCTVQNFPHFMGKGGFMCVWEL